MRRTVPVVAAGLLWFVAATPGSESPLAAVQQTFRSSVEVVELTVTVTDERGRLVTALRREDFTILEEGRSQTVTVFERINVPTLKVNPTLAGPSTAAAAIATNNARPDGRVFALVLDDQLTQPARTIAVRRLGRQFVQQHVEPTDLVGVFSTGGRSALRLEFTTDHAAVLQTIDRFQGNRIRQGETDAERVYSIETAMDAVEDVATRLMGVRGRRVTALFISEGVDYDIFTAMRQTPDAPGTGGVSGAASGSDPIVGGNIGTSGSGASGIGREHRPEPTPVIRAMQGAMEALSQTNVVLYAIDPRGLYSQETEWLEHNARDKTAAPPPDPKELARSIQSLRVMSDRTGGFAAVNTNDFGTDFDRIVQESSQYYVLGYSPSRRSPPGEYRKIAVKVRPGLRVSTREGYVVPPPRIMPSDARPELAALDDPLPRPGLGLKVQAIAVSAKGPATLMQIVLEVDGGNLSFREEEGKFTERVNLALKTVDDLSQEANRTASSLTMQSMTTAQRDRLVRTGLRWLTSLELAPGHHSLRIAAHAFVTGLTGSIFVELDVPRLFNERADLTDIVVTSSSSAETPTAGGPSTLASLPGPPTTRRTFRLGETITLVAGITSRPRAAPAVTAEVTRLDGTTEKSLVEGSLPLLSQEGSLDYVRFSLPTVNFGLGSFAITIRSRLPDGTGTQERKATFDVVPNSP